MVLNFLEWFVGTNPIGDTCKLGKGGVEKGPPILPKATSLVKFSDTIWGCAKAVIKRKEKEKRCPGYCTALFYIANR